MFTYVCKVLLKIYSDGSPKEVFLIMIDGISM